MQNVVKEPTRLTLETKTLIDLIVTTKPELINIKGVLPLGISDHNLIYATLKLRQKRPPPRIITIRNVKNFNIKEFHVDLSRAPFYVANVFEDKDDCSVGRALHWHRRGHGFESHSSLSFFQAFFSQLLKLRSNCEDLSSI